MSAGEIDRPKFMKAVFGNRDRMDVWGAVLDFSIEPPERFCAEDIRKKTDVLTSTVHKQIGALYALGAIQEAHIPQSWGRLFERVESPVWPIVAAAIEATQDMP